jgi:hypothetical protein
VAKAFLRRLSRDAYHQHWNSVKSGMSGGSWRYLASTTAGYCAHNPTMIDGTA